MMMPANYSAISAEEMTYVNGGEFDLQAGLATLGNNVWTIIGNTFVSKLVESTLGALFQGTYVFGNVTDAVWKVISGGKVAKGVQGQGKYVNTWLGAAMQVVGVVAAVDQLMATDTKNYTKDKLISVS